MYFKLDRHLKTILILSVAVMLVTVSTGTMGNIQKTISVSIQKENPSFQADAYTSQAIFSGSFAIFNWIVPSINHIIGSKMAMCAGASVVIVFILQFLIPTTWGVYGSSALAGFGGALIWTTQGNYLTMESNEKTITRNYGIFYSIVCLYLVIGNILVTITFHGKEDIEESTRVLVIIVLASCCVAGLIMFLLLPKNNHEKKKDILEEEQVEGPLQVFVGAVKLLCTKNMVLLSFLFLYAGLETAFYVGVYSSCVGFTKSLNNRKGLVGISGSFMGVGEILGSVTFILLGNKIEKLGKSLTIIIGALIHVLAFCLIVLNLPDDSPFNDTDEAAIIQSNTIIAIFCSFLLGLGDCVFINMISSLLGTFYADKSTAAFAIFQFVQMMGALLSFIITQFIGLYYQIGILLLLAIIGTLCFIKVDSLCKNQKATVPIEPKKEAKV